MSHAALNQWCVRRALAGIEAGSIVLPYTPEDAATAASAAAIKTSTASGEAAAATEMPVTKMSVTKMPVTKMYQITGKAGDVVLMHPWLIHTGSTNCVDAPRLMANGMAQIKPASFASVGCRWAQ
jgi:hypothetical protein